MGASSNFNRPYGAASAIPAPTQPLNNQFVNPQNSMPFNNQMPIDTVNNAYAGIMPMAAAAFGWNLPRANPLYNQAIVNAILMRPQERPTELQPLAKASFGMPMRQTPTNNQRVSLLTGKLK